MASRKSSAGERVLEGRHVIGLFFLMLLFSGVFFTLGYVMGRNQLDAQVRASSTHGNDTLLPLKAEPSAKPNKSPVSTPGNSDPATDVTTPPSSEWEFYRVGDKSSSNNHLKPPPAISSSTQPKTVAASAKSASSSAGRATSAAPAIPRGSYLLQVVALRTESDAVSVANELRKKKFPAFVQAPQGDKYYRVQVGPYADLKAMQTAKKGLETAGFKAIIKH
jgi:septal ring-binding cell division protein DamX